MIKIKHNLDVMRSVGIATYKEWAAYRTHSMVSILTGPVYFIVQIFIWKAVYGTRPVLNNLTLEQMILYFATAALINYLIMDFADWNLQMLIHTGKFITFMLRPMSHIYFAFSQKVGHRILGFIFEFIPVYFILLLVFHIRIVPASFWSVISIILAFIMMFLVNYCLGITAFWLTRTAGLRSIFLLFRNVCSGMLVPLSFFPNIIQKILFFLPFQFAVYVPIRVFIGSYELGGTMLGIPQIVGIQAGVVFFMAVLTVLFFRIGIHRFTGVGV